MLLAITVASAVVFVFAAFVVPLVRLLIRQALSPLRHLPSPPCTSLFMGNLPEMHDQENNDIIQRWVASYGHTFSYRGFIGGRRLMTIDPLAISHILSHAYQYPKPDFVRDSLASMAAGHDGILTVEGEVHRRQRKILAPAFSLSAIHSLTPIFWDKAIRLRDIWLNHADAVDQHYPKSTRVDALSWLARATLDVIGEAGFGYHFHSLDATPSSKSNELAEAFSLIFSTARKFRVMTILQVWFPILRRFRRNNFTMINAKATMRRIGLQLIAKKREEVQADLASEANNDKASRPRDLLNLLIRSNLNSAPSDNALHSSGKPATPELSMASQSGHMSTKEVLSQISTFIAAGHETTASALTWCLYALARDRLVQSELRRILRELDPKGGPQQDNLTKSIEACTYLDWVIRESMRLHAPVTGTMRVCAKKGGDCIPLSTPLSAPASKRASTPGTEKADDRTHIFLAEGDIITIPIQAVNRSKDIWGEDASEFRPERWASPIPDSARAIQGLYAHTLTFLNGGNSGSATNGMGNRSCIGWRFALSEIKIFIFVLLKDLEFELEEGIVIEKKVNVVTRPFVKSEPALGNQMPLNIRRAPS